MDDTDGGSAAAADAADPSGAPAAPAPTGSTGPTGDAAPDPHAPTELSAAAVRSRLETAMFEMKRVIVGQERLLERVLIALLTGGHLLIEGVPGLAKTLTVRTLAQVVGGTHSRVQFTPDLVPSDLVGTRIYRPGG